MKDAIKMGLRSLVYRRKQYRSLFIVCIFGVAISLFTQSVITGMISSLKYKAKVYYGGDFQFVGGDYYNNQFNGEENLALVKSVFPNDLVVERYNFDPIYAALYFEGMEVRLRMAKGVDFDAEADIFKTLNYKEGSAENLKGTNGILISEKIADTLAVHCGDSVTFLLTNREGATDTLEVIVKGIFVDSSFFGMYTSYMDIDFLKAADKYPLNWSNRICITLKNGEPSAKQIANYQKELEKSFNMFPIVEDKYDFFSSQSEIEYYDEDDNFNPVYALIKLDANLESLKVVIDAMNLVSAFIIVMLIVIIVVGVASTFRVIIMKRINEIGIYKAIGMKRGKLSLMILVETVFLIFSGCIGGFILSLILVLISRNLNLSFIPAFDLFLTNGTLAPIVSFLRFLTFSLTICVTTAAAVLFAVKKSVRIMPCKALAVTE
ncbi:MAG: FtsX-like permease family protein [Treponema sp.]|nr:FtsX-like permease family protein [Treponema sp.]